MLTTMLAQHMQYQHIPKGVDQEGLTTFARSNRRPGVCQSKRGHTHDDITIHSFRHQGTSIGEGKTIIGHCTCTIDDSRRTGTTEIVQAIKSVKENIEDSEEMKIWDQTMYL